MDSVVHFSNADNKSHSNGVQPDTISPVLRAAKEYVKLGFSVIPVSATTKKPNLSLLPTDESGKASWKEYQRRRPRERELTEWFSGTDARLAVIGGKVSGNLVIVDVDDLDLALDIRESGFLKDQLAVTTINGGLHLYLRTRAPVRSRPYGFGEIRSSGAYVLAPPSTGVDDEGNPGEYKLEAGDWSEIPEVEDWQEWWDAFCERFDIDDARKLKPVPRDIKRDRHINLTRLAAGRRYKTKGDDADAIFAWLREENRKRVTAAEGPLQDEEVRRIAEWAAALPLSEELSDLGNARRMAAAFGSQIRFSDHLGWLYWTGKRWKPGAMTRAYHYAQRTVELIMQESDSESVQKFALRSQQTHAIDAMLKQFRALPEIAITDPGVFDHDKWLLNVSNGTLDLRTGKLREHDPNDLITKLAPVRWDAKSSGEHFKLFIRRVLPDRRKRGYVQRILGYSLTGDVGAEILPVFYGTGANGKSKLLGAVMGVMGDYAKAGPRGLLTINRNENRFTLATLEGARLVTTVETGQSARLNEEMVNLATGGDKIPAERKGKDPYDFAPTHKLILVTNHEPIVRDPSNGIWRRLKKVHFDVTIPESERDEHLADKLKDDYSFILRWLVAGCLAWQKDGLQEPEEVKHDTDEWRDESDILRRFVEDKSWCERDRTATTEVNALRRAYVKWCERNEEYVMSKTLFTRRLKAMGFVQDAGRRNWKGLKLIKRAA